MIDFLKILGLVSLALAGLATLLFIVCYSLLFLLNTIGLLATIAVMLIVCVLLISYSIWLDNKGYRNG